jgi:cysteinyl-tRNA synthetase
MLSQGLSTEARQIARQAFRTIGNVFGLFQLDRWQFNPTSRIATSEKVPVLESLSVGVGESATVLKSERFTDTEIETRIAERIEAKRRKDFKRADAIRQALTAQGIIIEDKPDGTSRWKR